jgi:hypothetical protein
LKLFSFSYVMYYYKKKNYINKGYKMHDKIIEINGLRFKKRKPVWVGGQNIPYGSSVTIKLKLPKGKSTNQIEKEDPNLNETILILTKKSTLTPTEKLENLKWFFNTYDQIIEGF